MIGSMDSLVNERRVEEVQTCIGGTRDQLLASIAISLKRIADALSGPKGRGGAADSHTAYELLDTIADAVTGKGDSFLTAPINSYGEGIGDAIQGQMVRGQRGIDQYEGR